MMTSTRPQTPLEVRRLLKTAYAGKRGMAGTIIQLRPLICPFEEILARIPMDCEVLDVGCGTGIMTSLIAQSAAAKRVLGIDVSRAAIAVASASAPARNGLAEFAVLPPFDFPSHKFDVTLCVDVLHHIPRDRQWEFLERVSATLRPGGLLVLKDISPRPWWKAQANRLHDLLMARQWVRYRHEAEVLEQLARWPGRLQESTRLDRLWYSHYLVTWRSAT